MNHLNNTRLELFSPDSFVPSLLSSSPLIPKQISELDCRRRVSWLVRNRVPIDNLFVFALDSSAAPGGDSRPAPEWDQVRDLSSRLFKVDELL